MTELEDRVSLINLEINQTTEEQEMLADVKQSLLLEKYQKNVATLPRSRRFLGTRVALGVGARLILGDPFKEAACTAALILNLCDDTRSMSKDVEEILKTRKKEKKKTLQRVQSANDENWERSPCNSGECEISPRCGK